MGLAYTNNSLSSNAYMTPSQDGVSRQHLTLSRLSHALHFSLVKQPSTLFFRSKHRRKLSYLLQHNDPPCINIHDALVLSSLIIRGITEPKDFKQRRFHAMQSLRKLLECPNSPRRNRGMLYRIDLSESAVELGRE